ncbi:hypothetical protein SAMN04487938_2927 [Lysobacter sp. cf310]|nr:hypothetical protein SAMN04487938_2927 [Lysobacter sp. cf310]
MRQKLAAAALLACSWAGGGLAAQPASQAAGRPDPTPAPDGSATTAATEAIRDAIAGPLIDAISLRLGGRAVELRLDLVEVRAIDADQRAIRGSGAAQIVGRQDWIGFRFGVRYDVRLRRSGRPDIGIDAVAAGERDVPNDPRLVRQLETMLSADLAQELRKPSAQLRLDRVSSVEDDGQRLRIDALGTVYPDPYGPGTPLAVTALYDRPSHAWLRLEYRSGDDAASGFQDRRASAR